MDSECYNMAVRMIAYNIARLIIEEDKYHFMDSSSVQVHIIVHLLCIIKWIITNFAKMSRI
jgi:hypothetical protein